MFGNIAQIFRRKEKSSDPADLGLLLVDVHSHFIPGIDDGASSMEISLELLSAMASFGYQKVITTPHVMSDYYRNTSDIIRNGCEQVREAAHHAGIDIRIECAAEYYLEADFMEKIRKKELLTFGDGYVLFELPFLNEPPNTKEAIFEMLMAGYKPVLAHPERYVYWHHAFEKYEEMCDKGVLLQLNINSLTGHYSPQVKKISERLIDLGVISFVGSDCHHVGHINLMKRAAQLPMLHRLINSGSLLNKTL